MNASTPTAPDVVSALHERRSETERVKVRKRLPPHEPAIGMRMRDPVDHVADRQSLLDGLYGHTGGIEFVPELLADEGAITENVDGSVPIDLVLRDGLTWSDGLPLASDDVKFTFDVLMATDDAGEFIYLYRDRTGYDTISDFTVVSDTEFPITWPAFFAGWKTLFDQVYPAHSFASDPAAAAAELNEHLRNWSTPQATSSRRRDRSCSTRGSAAWRCASSATTATTARPARTWRTAARLMSTV